MLDLQGFFLSTEFLTQFAAIVAAIFSTIASQFIGTLFGQV